MSLMTNVRSARRPEREATLPPPLMLPIVDMIPLGVIRGRRWFAHDGAEFALDTRPLYDASPLTRLTDGATYVSDTLPEGELVYYHATRHPKGSYAAGGRMPAVVKVRRARPVRRIDALNVYPLLDARSARWVTPPVPREPAVAPLSMEAREMIGEVPAIGRAMVGVSAPARRMEGSPRARGADAIRSRLASVGVQVGTLPDGRIEYYSPGGRMAPELRELVRLVTPVLRGDPCAQCDSPSWTIVEPFVPACERHATEEVK